MNLNDSFAGIAPLSDQFFVQSLGLSVLPEVIISWSIATRKYLDVDRFVKDGYLDVLTRGTVLARTTTCLGRTFYFQRASVDDTLDEATIEI